MKVFQALLIAISVTSSFCSIMTEAIAAEHWQEGWFPAPNGGTLVFAIMSGGNLGCASYDAANCLWGKSIGEIDFTRVKPLVCRAAHRRLYGVTGFEDPSHWCNLALSH